MLPINKAYLTNQCSYSYNNPKYVVIHYTGNNRIDKAVDNVKWAYGLGENVSGSAHYYIDDEECYQLVPENRGAWSVGDDNGFGRFAFGVNNQNSISIEMCCTGGAYYVSETTQNNAAELAANLLKKYGLCIDRLKRHYDCSRKSCPAQFTPANPYYNKNDGEQNWNNFKEKVNKILNGVPVEEEKYYKGDDEMFSINWYLNRYPDVANSKTYKNDPYKHYLHYGKKEGRKPLPSIPSNYIEGDYLSLNPDVKAAVDKGTFTSGIHHYLLYGFKENRKINKNESTEAMKKRVAELEKKIKDIKNIVK